MKTMTESLTADQVLILQYLEKNPGKFMSAAAIAQQADDQKRYRENPYWANHALFQLAEMKRLKIQAGCGFQVETDRGAKCPAPKAGEPGQEYRVSRLEAILLEHGFCFCLKHLQQQSLEPQRAGVIPVAV